MQKILFSLLFLSSQLLLAQADYNPLADVVSKLKKDPALKNASWSVYAVELGMNQELVAHQEDMSLVPASALKLVTTISALEILGDSIQYSTDLSYQGHIDSNGVLVGDLYIFGYGDPTLGSKYFHKTRAEQEAFLQGWIKAVKDAGIDSITGNVVADASYFTYATTPSTWIWGDMGNYYGAFPAGLNVFDNLYTIHYRTGSKAGAKSKITKVVPQVPDMIIKNEVTGEKTDSDNAYVFGAPYVPSHVIRGSIPINKSDFQVKGALPDPAHMLAWKFVAELEKASVGVRGWATTTKKLNAKGLIKKRKAFSQKIHTEWSPPISEIVYWTNMKSVNLFAEDLACQIGKQELNIGDPVTGAAAMQAYWRDEVKMDITGMQLNDGSGLSRFNAITARQLVQLLMHAHQQPYYPVLKKSLPIAGKSGTLANMMKGTIAEGRVYAKSGSMTRVRCYAGYVENRAGQQIAFAILVNNYTCSSSEIKRKLQELMVALVE